MDEDRMTPSDNLIVDETVAEDAEEAAAEDAQRLVVAAVVAEEAEEAEAEAVEAQDEFAEVAAEAISNGEPEVAAEAIEELEEAAADAQVLGAIAREAEQVEEQAAEDLVEDVAIAEIAEEAAEEDAAEVVVEAAVEEKAKAKPKPEPAAKEAKEEEPPAAKDPFEGPGDWYVVHTYAGYENKVKTNLNSRIHTMQMEGKIFHVHIPMEDVMEIKGGKKQVVQKKVFPGYLLVKMFYDNDSWYVVRNTPGVTGFVSAGTGTKPTPLSKREVDKILVVKKEEVKPSFRLGFDVDDVVRIISGPFADFNGTITEINLDQSKLKVLVNIFDRETPVELGFDQVAKV
jgi:transcriptional antiterminator NusG